MNLLGDQAEGLRRLLGRQGLRVLLFVSGARRSGQTTAATNIAIAAAQMGGGVLLLDENRSATDAANLCGVSPRFDLLDALRGHKSAEEVVASGPEGVLFMPAARALRASLEFGEPARQALAASFERIALNLDWLVIDAASGLDTRLLPLALSAQEVVLSLPEDGDAITQSYALVKRIHREFGVKRYCLLATRARREALAREQCDRLSQTARRHLGIDVRYLGSVPFDPAVRRAAALARPLMCAFPAAPAARAMRSHTEALLQLPSHPSADSPVAALVQRLIEGSRLEYARIAAA